MHPLSPNQFGYPLSLKRLAYLYALIGSVKVKVIDAKFTILKG